MLLLAVLMDEGFYKKCLHDHFAVPKKKQPYYRGDHWVGSTVQPRGRVVLKLGAGSQGFPLSAMNLISGYFHRQIDEK